jgi:hypothetical protein
MPQGTMAAKPPRRIQPQLIQPLTQAAPLEPAQGSDARVHTTVAAPEGHDSARPSTLPGRRFRVALTDQTCLADFHQVCYTRCFSVIHGSRSGGHPGEGASGWLASARASLTARCARPPCAAAQRAGHEPQGSRGAAHDRTQLSRQGHCHAAWESTAGKSGRTGMRSSTIRVALQLPTRATCCAVTRCNLTRSAPFVCRARRRSDYAVLHTEADKRHPVGNQLAALRIARVRAHAHACWQACRRPWCCLVCSAELSVLQRMQRIRGVVPCRRPSQARVWGYFTRYARVKGHGGACQAKEDPHQAEGGYSYAQRMMQRS